MKNFDFREIIQQISELIARAFRVAYAAEIFKHHSCTNAL